MLKNGFWKKLMNYKLITPENDIFSGVVYTKKILL